jgi:hypothetical protein
VSRENWLKSFKQTASQWWKVRWVDFQLTPELAKRTQELAVQKYSQDAYNRKK